MNKNIALCDLDGTLANYAKSFVYHSKQLNYAPNTKSSLGLGLLSSEEYSVKQQIQNHPNFWRDLEPIENGFKVYNLIKEIGFKTHILTKAPKNCITAWSGKAEWCAKHLPNVDITMTHDKSLVYGKVLFDDWPDYVEKWLDWRPRGLVVMLSQPWNISYKHNNVFKVDQDNFDESLKQLKPILEKAYNR